MKKNKIRGVMFDMDGLMFDTENLINEIMREVGPDFDLPVTDELLYSLKGVNRQEVTRRMLDYWDLNGREERLVAYRAETSRRRDAYLEEKGVPVKKGLYELLAYLKENGYRIGLATSTERSRAEHLLKMADVFKYFDRIVYGNQVPNGKPCPDIYLRCAQELGISPEQCLVLEDAPAGIEAGHRAGAHVIGVPDFAPIRAREKEMCDDIRADLNEVILWLNEN